MALISMKYDVHVRKKHLRLQNSIILKNLIKHNSYSSLFIIKQLHKKPVQKNH